MEHLITIVNNFLNEVNTEKVQALPLEKQEQIVTKLKKVAQKSNNLTGPPNTIASSKHYTKVSTVATTAAIDTNNIIRDTK